MYSLVTTFDQGILAVGDGHELRWTMSGNPKGKPVVLLHGGPGAGLDKGFERMFDPSRYRIVQFDQRNCGQSTPYAGAVEVDLSTNTTQHLIGDIETLRKSLGIDEWLVWGGSWGSTLGLAYAETYPASVTELVLSIVCRVNGLDVEWVTRAMGRVFPEQWQAFVSHLSPSRRAGNLAREFNELLMNPDPDVHGPAALVWCGWEDVHLSLAKGFAPDLVNEDPDFRLCFSRLVTRYWANASFLDDDYLVDNAHKLAGIPTFLSHGRLDVSSPMDFPVALAEAIPDAELFISERDGHGGPEMVAHTIAVADRLALSWGG